MAPQPLNTRILIADDGLSKHDYFRKILEPSQKHYELDFVTQGVDAIKMVKKSLEEGRPYAVAFVDARMPPGIDGVKTIDAIWKIDSQIQAVICTSDADYAYKDIVATLGNSDQLLILKKPFDQLELLQMTNALTHKWSLCKLSEQRFQQLEFESSDYFKQLVHAQKMEAIGRLASGIAHDFNNLLTINLGYAGLLLGKEQLSERARHCVEAMNDATTRAAGLTKQLLAFSRQQNTVATIIEPNQAISSMKALLARAVGENIELSLDLASNVEPIKIDQTQFEQILLNLVLNSRDAIADCGKITVSTRTAQFQELGTATVISVKDNGHGMSDEIKDKIFEPFFTTKNAERGTGLGLSTIFGIVQKNLGHITVDTQVGKGTSVHIAFPVATKAISTDASTLGVSAPAKPVSIMVVDDENEVRQVVLEMLQNAGFQVYAATNGSDALKQLDDASKSIDLVLTDVVMPKVTGIQLAELLTKAHPSLPVVFMSGHTRDEQFQKEVESGLKRFIQKPFSHDSLVAALQAALNL